MVVISGENVPCGAYLLRITVAAPLMVTFGRFLAGAPISVPAGDYVYVGSARGKRGSTTLARRLMRHATRAEGPAHRIRSELQGALERAGMVPAEPPATKRLHWNVDHLLEERQAEITAVYILRTMEDREPVIARALADDPAVTPLCRGLGAADDPGTTHLLAVPPGYDPQSVLAP